MYRCPRCRESLDDTHTGQARVYPCAQCGGHALALSQLRSVTATARFQPLWQAARAAPPAALACPACANLMRAPLVHGVEVDACIGCQLVWLDPGEQEKLVGAPRPPPPAAATDAQLARQLLAIDQVAASRETRRTERRVQGVGRAAEILLELMWWVTA